MIFELKEVALVLESSLYRPRNVSLVQREIPASFVSFVFETLLKYNLKTYAALLLGLFFCAKYFR